MKRVLPIFAAALAACSSTPYEVRLCDDRSISFGALHMQGYAVPDLPPGVRLIDARPGQRLVLWNDEYEFIIDIDDPCEVLFGSHKEVRPANPSEIEMLLRLLPGWPLEPSTHPDRYAAELATATAATSDRLLPTHIDRLIAGLPSAKAIDLALANIPKGWMERGGRVTVLGSEAGDCSVADLGRIVQQAVAERFVRDSRRLIRACLQRKEMSADHLRYLVQKLDLSPEREESSEIEAILAHPSADEDVFLAAIELLSSGGLSALRRKLIEGIAALPAATENVLIHLAAVDLDYDDDRVSVISKIVAHPQSSDRVRAGLRLSAEKIRDASRREAVVKKLAK